MRNEWILVTLAVAALSESGWAQKFLSIEEASIDGIQPPSANDVLFAPGSSVSDGTVTLTAQSGLPSSEAVGIYPQIVSPIPTPSLTDTSSHLIFEASDLSADGTSYSGPLSLEYRYSPTQFIGSESTVRLFRFDYTQGMWLTVPAALDTVGDRVFTTITQPGFYGLGVVGTLAVPALGGWGLLLLSLVLAAGGAVVLRRRQGTARAAVRSLLLVTCAAIGSVAVVRDATGAGAQTTSAGNPIRYATKVGVVRVAGMHDGQAVTWSCWKVDIWQYSGAGNVNDRANWTRTPSTEYGLKSQQHAPPNVPGATATPAAYDQANYPFYDCAGFALRNSGYIPVDPNVDAWKIIQDEYTCIGLATGMGYQVGDVVTYKKNGKVTHYAKVKAVDAQGKITELESKWGRRHIMVHGLTNVPAAYGTADQVYRKN